MHTEVHAEGLRQKRLIFAGREDLQTRRWTEFCGPERSWILRELGTSRGHWGSSYEGAQTPRSIQISGKMPSAHTWHRSSKDIEKKSRAWAMCMSTASFADWRCESTKMLPQPLVPETRDRLPGEQLTRDTTTEFSTSLAGRCLLTNLIWF